MKKPAIKVLFFIDSLTAAGKERRLVELMTALKKTTNIEFELVVMSHDIHYKEVYDLGIKVHQLIRKTKKDLSILGKFYNICKTFRPHIVHCWDSMTAVYSIFPCKLLRIKLVNGMVVDTPQNQNIFNTHWFRAKLTFPFSDKIIGNSKAGLAAYKAPRKKSVCIYNGFNFDRTKKLLNNNIIREELRINKRYIIGMVATFSDYKDYKTYFNAAELLLNKRDDIIFLAIGKETDSDSCRNLFDKRNEEHFRLLGKKSGIESYINNMDIGVLATFTEGISNSILEYMALGKPVVASSGGGTKEIIEDNKTGFLVNTSDPGQLAEKIEILLNSDDLRKNMGCAGRERVKKVFSIENMIDKYVSFYEEISADFYN